MKAKIFPLFFILGCALQAQTYSLLQTSRPNATPGPAYESSPWLFSPMSEYGPTSVAVSFTNTPATQDITTVWHEESLMLGATSTNAPNGKEIQTISIHAHLGRIGQPSSTYFSASIDEIGSGINAEGLSNTQNGAFVQYTSAEYLAIENPFVYKNDTFELGTVTYTFSKPVDNPIIHVSGLGAISQTGTNIDDVEYLWFSTELELTGDSEQYSLERLSGSRMIEEQDGQVYFDELIFDIDASGKKIVNRFADNFLVLPDQRGTQGDEAASGSARIVGENIKHLTFKVWMRAKSDGRWTQNTMYAGDEYTVSFSFNENICVKPAVGSPTATSVGISTLNRNVDNWLSPAKNENMLSAYIALESTNKAFVITRNSNPEANISEPVEGMVVWDTAANCLKVYKVNSQGEGSWNCTAQGCNE
ncbi:MAG: hypothetical protein Q4G27_10250 [Flavobacteriaceae bacterium]|nr:hypothetical protein [Flavobacteriaceae bacterium]